MGPLSYLFFVYESTAWAWNVMMKRGDEEVSALTVFWVVDVFILISWMTPFPILEVPGVRFDF